MPKFWKEFVHHQKSLLPSAEIRAQMTSGTLHQCCVMGTGISMDEATEAQRGAAPCPRSHSCGSRVWVQVV